MLTALTVSEGVIAELEKNGFEAYAVGGCVRDALIGRKAYDIDIATSAEPSQVKRVFSHTADTGIVHGTVTVFFEGNRFEVTTYRTDGAYKDHRRPEAVSFAKSLADDLSRRDFTVNAMAYHPQKGIIDLFGGQEDLKKKIIRTVGDAKVRFNEDALRMLRGIRFCAVLGFTMASNVYDGIEKMHSLVRYVSAERIWDELSKIILSPRPQAIRELYRVGLLQEFLPELAACFGILQNNPHHVFDVGEHTLRVMQNTRAELCLRLAAMLHDVAKPICRTTDNDGIDHFKGHPQKGAEMAAQILSRLRCPKKVIKNVQNLILWHDYRFAPTREDVKCAANKIGDELFCPLMELKKADAMAQNPELTKEKLETIIRIEEIYADIKKSGEPYMQKHLKINGNDLVQEGILPSAEYGGLFKELVEHVIRCPEENEKDRLLAISKKIMEERLWKQSE